MRVLVSGSRGLIGTALVRLLHAAGHEVVPLVRTKEETGVFWDPDRKDFSKEEFEGFDAVVHLAGENIGNGRWTAEKKKRLVSSRCRDSSLLAQVLVSLNLPPKVVVSASAIGFYGDRGEELLTEKSSAGKGFLADLCAHWEEAIRPVEARGIRLVCVRFGPVLSSAGGFLSSMLVPFKMGLGGRLGSGKQKISWIGLDDAAGAIIHALTTESLSGPLNATAPNPVTQAEFARALARRLHRPALLPLPASLLRIVFGEKADELLLASTCAMPEKLLQTGYRFRAPDLNTVLDEIFKRH